MADAEKETVIDNHDGSLPKEVMPYGIIPTDELIKRYSGGWFPMSYASDKSENGMEMAWFNYTPRGVIPLDKFKIPHGSKPLIKNNPYHVTIDQDFEGVMRGCSEITEKEGRNETWINEEIIQSYIALQKNGHAHSIEVRDDNNMLVGGLYGVSIGGIFFGESMFSTVPGASKVALVKLVEILKNAGYKLLDVQEVGKLTAQFGAIEIPRSEYEPQLEASLKIEPDPSKAFTAAAKAFRPNASESIPAGPKTHSEMITVLKERQSGWKYK